MLRTVTFLAALFFLPLCQCGAQQNESTGRTTTKFLRTSLFAGFGGTYTGYMGGQNLAFSAGGNLSYFKFGRLSPSVEVRGKYPVYEGSYDSQKNVLGGLRGDVAVWIGHIYGDFLYGRGVIEWNKNKPSPNPLVRYRNSSSNVISPGLGASIDIKRRTSIYGDIQFERYTIPTATPSYIVAKSYTTGVRVRFH